MVEQPFRLRINYQKIGRLTHLSHLEVVRALERVVRRSQLPYVITAGFSAHMKHAFGPALPVGTGGLDEYLDVWLTDYVPIPIALRSLQEVAPESLPIFAVRYVEKSVPSLQVSHRFSTYEVLLRADAEQLSSLRRACEELLSEGCLNVQRKGKIKVFALSRYLSKMPEMRIVREGVIRLDFVLIADENGSLRPENLLAGLCDGSDTLDVISITRVKLKESL
ncbi:MAG: DUF2344 domain-containing protein [Coriobacteriaceae bacterium]|nr:DUF2344 domain-containing protein [Coriobacteriaceae bacterium]